MSQLMLNAVLLATWQTLYMVFIASFLSIVIGLAVGVALFITRPGEMLQHKGIHGLLGLVVNITRSVPFVIYDRHYSADTTIGGHLDRHQCRCGTTDVSGHSLCPHCRNCHQ